MKRGVCVWGRLIQLDWLFNLQYRKRKEIYMIVSIDIEHYFCNNNVIESKKTFWNEIFWQCIFVCSWRRYFQQQSKILNKIIYFIRLNEIENPSTNCPDSIFKSFWIFNGWHFGGKCSVFQIGSSIGVFCFE